MGNTPYYNLGYIEPSQDLSKNLDLDELRFKTLDTQLFALYQIFKNGIIEDGTNNNISWRINTYSDSNKFLKISVTIGKGHVSFKAAETTEAKDVQLPPLPSDVNDVKIWFYAIENINTPVTRDVDFIASLTQIDDTDNYINIGGVTINLTNSLIDVFYDDRQIITIFESLSSLIYNHKHIGGSANPSPIDLNTEVKNKLSGDGIENIDLTLVTQGKLKANRLPEISHFDLTDIGALSHSQIDSLLAQNLENDNTYQLSNLSIANRLQTLIALKKQSGFEYIDSTQINTLVYVPGIWPNTDTNSSTGITSNFYDSNIPSSLIGSSVYDAASWVNTNGIYGASTDYVYSDVRTYTTKRDFQTAQTYNQNNNIGLIENIKISGSSLDSNTGYFNISTPLNFKAVEQPVSNIFNASSGWYRATNSTSNYSNQTVSVDTRLYSYKIFTNPIAMNEVSHIGIGFSVGLGTTLSKIGQIYMYLVLGSDDNDPKFTSDIEVSFDSGQYYPTTGPSKLYLSSPDGSEIGYKIFDDTTESSSIGEQIYKTIDLDNLWPSQYRSSIIGYGFYWSSLKGWNPEKSINFYLNTPDDNQVNPSPYNYDELQTARKSSTTNSTASTFLWNEKLYSSSGKFLIRFDSGYENTVYDLVQWSETTPENTEVLIETRTDLNSLSFYDLNNIDNTTNLSSGNLSQSSNIGRYLDVLITLSSDISRLYSPTFNELKISYSSVGSGYVKTYNSQYSNFEDAQTGWETETYYSRNIGFTDNYYDDNKVKNKLKISSTSTIGNWVYLRNNSAISADLSDIETIYEDGVDSVNLSTYKSPVQIYDKSITMGFNTPKDFQQLEDGSNIYCDTLNDRVVMFNGDGEITKLIQGNIRLKNKQRDFVALAAYMNSDVRKIWAAFSQNISTSTPYDATKIYIIFDSNSVRLDDARIDQNNTGLFDQVNGNSATLEITFQNNDLGNALITSIENARVKKIRFDKGSITNGGYSENTVGIGTQTSSTTTYRSNNSISYLNNLNSNYSGISFTTEGIPTTKLIVSEDLDYNDDNVVPTENLLAEDEQIDDVQIDIYVGPIYFKNIYNPISVHYSNDKIIIAQPFDNSIIAFNDNTDLTTAFSIPFEIAEFVDTKLGSVYEVSDDLLLIGCPGVTSKNGKVLKYKVTGGITETKLVFSNLDVVKVLPGPNQDNFYVLLDDYENDGISTRLKIVDTTGNILSTWGENLEIIHPKGLRAISNNDILVSE